MVTTHDIESALRAELPLTLHKYIPGLAHYLINTTNRVLASGELQLQTATDPALLSPLHALGGKSFNIGDAIVHFPTEDQHDSSTPALITVERNVSTGGGDYAEGTIDKRQGVFFTNVLILPRTVQQESDLRYRETLSNRVHTFWIESVLESSTHGTPIELYLEIKPEYVDRTLAALVAPPKPSKPLQLSSTKIVELFDKLHDGLLILGGPGAGKTNLLLTIARELIERARERAKHGDFLPMPVVFNLSSWAEKQLRLADWLVEELSVRYYIDRDVGASWVETDQVLLLLDGLDEMIEEKRVKCVDTINQYRQQHGLTKIVVCSRMAAYEELPFKLQLETGVLVQTLTHEQVKAYFTALGESFAAIQKRLTDDPRLSELVASPLMLSIVAFTQEGAEDVEVPAANSEAWDQQLFTLYVTQMFARQRTKSYYNNEQTLRWLGWLAGQMKQRGQSQFLIEYLQPSWLPGAKHRALYSLSLGLTIGALCSLIGAFGRWIAYAPAWGLMWGITGWLGWFLTLVLSEILIYGFRKLGASAMLGLSWLLDSAVVFGLAGGVTIALRAWLRAKTEPLMQIRVIELLKWSWGRAIRSFGFGLVVGLVAMELLAFLVLLILRSPFEIMVTRLVTGLAWALLVGLLVGLVLGLSSGFSVRNIQRQNKRIAPNYGIKSSARYAAFVGLPLGIVVWAVVILLITAIQRIPPAADQNSALGSIINLLKRFVDVFLASPSLPTIAGLICFAMAFGLGFGGFACIQHIILRLLLWLSGCMPWNYAGFLDDASDRLLLHRVGGSYIFIHQWLLDHFASLDQSYTGREQDREPFTKAKSGR